MNSVIQSFESVCHAWAEMVHANREQVERLRETAPTGDFYALIASSFKADPHRTSGDDVLDYLRTIVRPEESWLDIGGGAGRYALPLALIARQVTVIDPSDGMLSLLDELMAEHNIQNVRAIQGRWPAESADLKANSTLISHVGYDIPEIGAFFNAMEHAATDRCVAVLMDRAPASFASPFWPAIHGEPRAELPGAREFLTLLLARGRLPSVRLFDRPPGTYPGAAEAQENLRHQLWVEAGSEKDERLREEIERLAIPAEKGIRFVARPVQTAVIEWRP
ncbi:MAG: class I SAM-dependent methyltransferase [Dehalococcoidia bacterium]|nr:class I SAM-dependent methyltransferase [Dehalococcoidia bacterium]